MSIAGVWVDDVRKSAWLGLGFGGAGGAGGEGGRGGRGPGRTERAAALPLAVRGCIGYWVGGWD